MSPVIRPGWRRTVPVVRPANIPAIRATAAGPAAAVRVMAVATIPHQVGKLRWLVMSDSCPLAPAIPGIPEMLSAFSAFAVSGREISMGYLTGQAGCASGKSISYL